MFRTSPRLAATVAAGALGLSLAASPLASVPAQADESTAAGCVAAGKVWLLVVTEDGTELANQCVGTPKTGTAALQAAKLELTRDKSNFICAIAGHPAKCPATFNGQFWNYYTLTPGGEWTFSAKGADQSAPKAGSVEGWCYNAPKTKNCAMPKVDLGAATVASDAASSVASAASSAASATSEAASTAADADDNSSTPWGVIGTVLALLAAAAGYFGWRRNQNKA